MHAAISTLRTSQLAITLQNCDPCLLWAASFRGVVTSLVPCVHVKRAALQARQQSATGSIDSLPISVATAATAATTTEGTSSSEVCLPSRFTAVAALRRTSGEAPKRLRFS